MRELFAMVLIGCVAASARADQAEDIAQLKKDVIALQAEVKVLKALLIELVRPPQQASSPEPAPRPRPSTANPFGVADVPDPDGEDVKAFAARMKLAGDAQDANAEAWAENPTAGNKNSLDGEWLGRWNFTGGAWVPSFKAEVKTVGDRVYILYRDHQGRFLADLKRENGRLVGRLRGIDNPSDTDPCVFAVVDGERLDGSWGGKGRLDLRRKLK